MEDNLFKRVSQILEAKNGMDEKSVIRMIDEVLKVLEGKEMKNFIKNASKDIDTKLLASKHKRAVSALNDLKQELNAFKS